MHVADLARTLSDTGARTILIDGRSGSGKSTLADQLQLAWRSSAIVRLDDIYPGWDGLAWAVDHVRTAVLEPRSAGGDGRWRRWDWATGAPAGWCTVGSAQRLIVEGAGALTAANRSHADLGIWVETPDAERKRRALLRDGELYRPHWDRWAAHEDEHIARYDPRSVADWTVTEQQCGLIWAPRSPAAEPPAVGYG